ncbi:MAG TPA: hypothetical protein VHI93_06765, partial [Candidatus Thermoplasmatota archaeon]|nr:hypothetical protein [Candidatus Thermoplasmatota archaeon]
MAGQPGADGAAHAQPGHPAGPITPRPALDGLLQESLAGKASAPSSLSGLLELAAAGPLEHLPLPQPAADAPLMHALSAYAAALEVPLPDAAGLRLAAARLGLEEDQEAALAQLVLAYSQAAVLQRAAMAALSPAERGLVGMDPAAVAAWMAQEPERTLDDLHAEVLRILGEKSDPLLVLQAADLLARAVEAARVPLARPPASRTVAGGLVDVAADFRTVVRDTLGLPPVPLPEAVPSLREALSSLYLAYGFFPPSPLPAPDLPPSFDRAVARIVAVKAEAAVVGDARLEASAFLEASSAAVPVLEAWAEVLRLRAAVPDLERPAQPAARESPAPLLGLLGKGAGQPREADALHAFEAARDTALRPLAPDERAAVLRGPEVQELFRQADWSPAQADLVGAWARAHLHMDPGALHELRTAAATLQERSGGSCTEALRREPEGCAGLRQAAAESAPLPALPANRQAGETTATEPPLFDDARGPGQGGHPDASMLCEERDRACVGPASLLRIGGIGSSEYGHVAVVHIDLGGDDHYVAEVAGTAAVGLRDEPENIEWPEAVGSQRPAQVACHAHGTINPYSGYCIPPKFCRNSPESPVCIPVAFSRGSYSIDLLGNDHYDTPSVGATQGATGLPPDPEAAAVFANQVRNVLDAPYFANGLNATAMAWASVLLDVSGNDQYVAKVRSQGSAAYGVGLLIDADGTDSYDAGPLSQGAATHRRGPHNSHAAAAVAGLFDLGTTGDHYQFTRQGSLLDEKGAGAVGVAAFLDAGGPDTYSSAFAIDPSAVTRAAPGEALRMQGHAEANAVGVALFLDAGIDRDTYLALDLAGSPLDLSAVKNDQWQPRTTGSVFIDGQPVDPNDLQDGDEDGAISLLERLWGTDPTDPASSPGNAFWVLANPEQVDPQDPLGSAGLRRPGPWLATPPLSLALSAGALYVPGLVIGGIADDVYNASVPFMVDLGGDDRYTGRHLGGAMPRLEGANTLRPAGTDVTLVLDVGGGDDTYAPQPCQVFLTLGTSVSSGPTGYLQSPPGTDTSHVTACPSLGGAVAGIALLGDDGGRNTFDAALHMRLEARSGLAHASI